MNRGWTPKELEILKQEREKGTKIPEIAAMLNRPVPATYTRARMIGAIVQPHSKATERSGHCYAKWLVGPIRRPTKKWPARSAGPSGRPGTSSRPKV